MIPANIQKLIDEGKYERALLKTRKLKSDLEIDEVLNVLIEKDYFPAAETKWSYEILLKIKENEGDGGEKTINNYLKKHPDSADAFYAKGKCLSLTKRESESIKYYDKAIEKFNSKHELSRLTLNQIILDKITSLLDIGNTDEAITLINDFEENATALYLKSRAYILLENYETAVFYADESLKIKKTAEAHYYKACAYYNLKDYYKATTNFIYSSRKSNEITSLDMEIDTNYKIGLTLIEYEKYQDAVKYFNKALNYEIFNLSEENEAKMEEIKKKKKELITYYYVKDKQLGEGVPLLSILLIIAVIGLIILYLTNNWDNPIRYVFFILIILNIIRYIFKLLI